jgi:hypothetical protein
MDFAIKNSWRVRLKPLAVESEIRDDLYLIVVSVASKTGPTGAGAGSAGYV